MKMHSFHRIFGAALVFISLSQIAFGEDKSDLILEELKRLRESIERLEDRVESLENKKPEVMEIAGPPTPTQGAVRSYQASSVASDDRGLVGRVVDAITVRDEAVQYPWMNPALWSQLQEGMSPDEVKGILGEPTLEDPSLHPRRDLVYTYRGRRLATGERVIGKVKFWREKVVVIETPSL